jgi:uncharacterized protein
MPFLKADEAPTQAEREKMPEHLFGLPDKKKYPLDTPEHVRAAASYGAKEHNAGRMSDHDFATLQANLKKAKKKFGIGEESQEDGHAGANDRADSLPPGWRVEQRYDLVSGEIGEHRTTPQGGLVARANFTRTGVFAYRQPDGTIRRELRHPDDVFEPQSMETLKHATLTDDHPDKVHPGNWKQVAIGHAVDPAKDGRYLAGEVHIQHGDAIEKAKSGKLRELSCGYECALDPTPGVFNGERYDARQRRIRYNHVAAGPAGWGRAGPEVRMRFDSGASVSVDGQPGDGQPSNGQPGNGQSSERRYVRDNMAETEAEKTAREAAERQARTDAEELTRLRAKNQEYEGELKVLRKKEDAAVEAQTAASTRARTDAQFEEQFQTITDARQYLGATWSHRHPDGTHKTIPEIRREVVKKLDQTIKLDGLSDAEIAGMFKGLTHRAQQSQRGRADMAFVSAPWMAAGGGARLDAGPRRRKPAPDDDEEQDPGDVAEQDSVKRAADSMAKRMKDRWKTPTRTADGKRIRDWGGKRAMRMTDARGEGEIPLANQFTGSNPGGDYSGGLAGTGLK